MLLAVRRHRFLAFVLVISVPGGRAARAEEALGAQVFVEIVLRSHPGARQAAAVEAAAGAERKAARQIPDPTLELSWDRATPEGSGAASTETAFSVSQTLPWPGTRAANVRAGDRAAEALRAEAAAARWELAIDARTAFARLLHARAALDIARGAEADALGLRDLAAKRAELGETREVDRIKAEVEWLRQQRARRSLEREAEAAETILRTLAVEPLPRPLALAGELPRPSPRADADALRERLARSNPRLAAARATAAREAARLSASRRGRVPDLDLTWFREKELDKNAHGFSVGLRVPLWNANRAEIARAAAARSLAEATAERVALDLEAALERARQELDVASTEAEMLERDILPAARRSLELARFSYGEGETSLLDLLDAQRTFRETERQALASRLALAQALADVQRLVGPDFDPGK
ncbi:MAG TPA: TolC family protein [Vicinamibacteria bacterium]|nr:TolC family protein [Vicinamibacteria bacterium]